MSNSKRKYINCGDRLVDISAPVTMGILNITPDSFYDGGKYLNEESVLHHVNKMLEDGAAIIDIGAQSTRPRAGLIDAEEEWERLNPLLKILRDKFPAAIFSVDTFYSIVAEKAIDNGADIINDISAGTIDEKMYDIIIRYKIPYIIMHMQGTPQTMQENPLYKKIVNDIMDFLIGKIKTLTDKGVYDIIIDPGFGFGKTLEHNYELLYSLELFNMLERPIMAGFSRKSMISKVLNAKTNDALNGTTVLNTIALMKGVNILRVHDVKEAVESIKIFNKYSIIIF